MVALQEGALDGDHLQLLLTGQLGTVRSAGSVSLGAATGGSGQQTGATGQGQQGDAQAAEGLMIKRQARSTRPAGEADEIATLLRLLETMEAGRA